MESIKDSFKLTADIIEKSNNIVLTTHVVPDGDAIGSVMAMSEYLRLKGKKPVVINHSQTPFNLKFLDPENSIRVFLENEKENKDIIENSDLIIILDTNEFSRTRSMQEHIIKSHAKKICIDHHTGLKPELFHAYISDTDYPSNCSILYEFIKSESEKFINVRNASALYVGIMTDTGSFRYPRTTSDVFRMCAELIDKGADPVHLYECLYATNTIENLKLASRFINSLEFHFDNEVVVGIVTQKDFKDLGLNIDHVEGFSSIIMNILGVKAGIILVELKDNIKVSFRSKGDIKVNELAQEFEGGGHKNAAGANVKDTNISDLKSLILNKLEKYLNN
ncbi:MAG TPA: bifunctional oligoribonuclease/PAP phosphatase NrnA [Ignavibacteria bacterium]|nr:bifunctional oligoribonuclease/PAP phosphatase NrnA [Ignavibacteria bacterium]